jgi:hypothetical protein BACCOPRO_03221
MVNMIPIVFAFDNRLTMPAAVCIYSLLFNAKPQTTYDIFILYPQNENLDTRDIDKVTNQFDRHRIRFCGISNLFDSSFEVRDITVVTYFRLLIPEVVLEYEKVIYSDVDVIFQDDLSDIYCKTNLNGMYLGAVNSLSHIVPNMHKYYTRIGLNPRKIFYAGNLIINSKELLKDGMIDRFRSMARRKFLFQDMDILNITCCDKVYFLGPEFCVTNYFCQYALTNRKVLLDFWTESEILNAFKKGIIHYNGQKPWKGYCVNFDIWWEYYRKSPVFEEKYYFDFFYRKLDEFDTLTLWKRIKILLRYFVYGKKKF